jgi:hypothetical protein
LGEGPVKSCGLFASGWTPEDGPGDEAGGEVDEAVVRAGGDEEDVAFEEGKGVSSMRRVPEPFMMM